MMRRPASILVAFMAVVLFLAPHPSFASPPPARHVLVILTDRLIWTDFDSALRPIVGRIPASYGLMSPGRPIGADPAANVYATLGAGDSIATGDVSEGRLARAVRDAGRYTAVVGDADGDDTGQYRPVQHLLPGDGIAMFGYDADEISDPLSPGGLRNDPGAMAALTTTLLYTNDLVVVHLGDLERLEREDRAGLLLPAVYRRHRATAVASLKAYVDDVWTALVSANAPPTRVYLIVASPPRLWDHLTPVAVADFVPDTHSTDSYNGTATLLTSATTRTTGLIAARDVAADILATLDVPRPIQMTGAPLEMVVPNGKGVESNLPRLDRITSLDQQVQTPFFWVFGFAGGLTVLISIVLFATGRRVGSPIMLYVLRVLTSWPLAMLLASMFDPSSVGGYLGWIGLLSLAIGLLPSPAVILFATAAVTVVDGFFGSTLVARSILSGYALSGIRFYGIGNEYMGVLIGGALMAPVITYPRLLLQRGVPTSSISTSIPPANAGTGSQARRRAWLAIWFVLVVFVLSFPAFGAKAGGAVTATATFLFAWWELRGQRIGVWRIIGAIVAGFALVLIWGFLGPRLGLAPTHIDSAVGALAEDRFGYIRGVAWRKIGLALRIILHPGTLLGLAGIVGLCVLVRTLLGRKLDEILKRVPDYRAVAFAGLRGCVVALLFNDSGIIAAILIVISLLMPLLYMLFRESGQGIQQAAEEA